MRKLSFFTLVILSLFLLVACNTGGVREDSPASKMVGNSAYLKVNLWYERPKKILTTNYHKGIMLKVGAKFDIIAINSRRIVFRGKHGLEFTIVKQRKHTLVDMAHVLERTFSIRDETKADGRFAHFSKMEQKNIRKGKVVRGMSKQAVLMSYGYPPEHRTPSIESDNWKYWRNRFVSKIASFEDNKLVSFR